MNIPRTSNCDPGFQYPPLPAGKDAIRIFRLEPGDFRDPLIGALDPVAFSAKPKYLALSYTWENSYAENAWLPLSPQWDEEQGSDIPRDKELRTITVNKQPFALDHNLFLALLHLRSPTDVMNMWVDAISINQADTNERNAQVAMMSLIYTRAAMVVAWLGTKNYSDVSSSIFNKMSIEWNYGCTQYLAASQLRNGQLRRSLEPDKGTVVRIAESSYWSRLWIVQEICIPRLVVFVYGSSVWKYEDLKAWLALQNESLQSSLGTTYEALIRLLNARDARYTDFMKLESLIEEFGASKCSNLRDKVYGLLGLSNDIYPSSNISSLTDPVEQYINSIDIRQDDRPEPQRGTGGFRIDYSRSHYDLWIDTIKFAFFRSKSSKSIFGSLSEAERRDESERNETARILEQRERAVSVVRTAGLIQEALEQKVDDEAANLDYQKHTQIGPIIRAIGYLSSEIVHLGPDAESLVSSFRSYEEWRHSWVEHYEQPEQLEILRRTGEAYYHRIMDYDRRDFERIRELRNPEILAWRIQRRRPQSSDMYHTPAWKFANGGQSTQVNEATICLGTNCTIAMVPSVAEHGDFIVQFWNCSAAVVMRPISSDPDGPASSFMMVGRADIAEAPDLYGSSRRHTRSEENLLCVSESPSNCVQSSGAVYIDLDFKTLQRITASINSRRKS